MPRTETILLLALALLATASIGCGESGVGAKCFAGSPDQPGNLKVLVGTGECTTSICVSYLDSQGYCTIECGDNGTSCPGGYNCCPVVQTGAQDPCSATQPCTSSRHVCRQGVCRPKQFCVQSTGACQ